MVIEEEYRSAQPVRFMSTAHSCMYDGEGNIILCKCGKPAGSGMMGKESYLVWCEDCSPYKDAWVADFVYRPPEVK